MESVSEYAFSKNYEDEKFALNYRNTMYNYLKDEEDFVSFCLHKIFQNEVYRGKRIIDIGCGPTVHRMGAASTYFSEIVLSDYSEYNRQEVQKWLKNESSEEDWDCFLKQEAQLQGYRNVEEGINEIKLQLRQKIKEVIHCDVLQKEILPTGVGKFDVMFTSFCLEGACTTLESFKSALKNMSKYILPNGELVMVTIFGSTSYHVEGYKSISSLCLNEKFLEDALKEAGFSKTYGFLMKNHKENSIGIFNGIGVLSATKNN